MSSILNGLVVVCLMDDVLIHGKTQEEHKMRDLCLYRRQVLPWISVNSRKLWRVFFFLGQIINSEGIQPDSDKVKAIIHIQEPSNTGDIRFLGMVNQQSKFSPHIADMTQSLRELPCSNKQWIWGTPQKRAFQVIKETLSQKLVLALYDPQLDTTHNVSGCLFIWIGSCPNTKANKESRPVA